MDNNAGGLGSTPTPDNSKSPVVQPPATGGGVVSPATAGAPSANLENSAATAASTPVEGAIFSGPTAANSLSGTGQPDRETAERARQFFAHHPAHTYSREMGDIVIGGEVKPKKMNKKPLIIGGVVLCVATIAAIILLLVTKQATKVAIVSQAQQSFGDYVAILKNNDGEAADNGAWFIQTVAEQEIQQGTVLSENFNAAAYADKILESYNVFLERCGEMDVAMLEGLEDVLQQNTALLENFTNYLRSGEINEELMTIYSTEGRGAAENYLEELLPAEVENVPIIETMSSILQNYFLLELDVFELYDEQGCLSDGILDAACVGEIDSEQSGLTLIASDLNMANNSAQGYFVLLSQTLETTTISLQRLVEDLNV